jgi:signal transduction histidine kinase
VLEAGFLAAAGAFVGARRDLLVTLRERAAQAENERDRRAEQARLAERARIAREMHDVVAHKMSLVALHAGGLEVNPESGRDQVEKTAALIRSTARDALGELRGVLGLLRDNDRDDGSDLAPQPNETDVPRLIEASRAAGLPLELHVQVPDLPAALGRATYRIVQEALTNAHKHARDAATQVSIIGDEASGVSVQVTNRCPVSASTLLPGSGTGLLGLQERVSTLGGRLDSGHTNEGGWRLAAWLPWSAPHPASGGPA